MATAQEIIVEVATRIQNIDEQIKELQEGRKEILKQAKDDGINTKLLNRAISEIRKAKKTTPVEKSEQELYIDLISSVITTLE